MDATLAALSLICSVAPKEIQEKIKTTCTESKEPAASYTVWTAASLSWVVLDIIWDNIWPWEYKGIFLEVADGEVYRTDITKDKTQRKGHNCCKGTETFFKKCPISNI